MSEPPKKNPTKEAVLSRTSIERLKGLAIIIGLLVLVLVPVILINRCGKSGDAARSELERNGIAFTEGEFINRVRHRELETVKLFLAAGFNPDTRDQGGATVLMEAVLGGDTGIIEALLNNGANANARATNNSTALHLSMLVGNYESARLLLRKGADVNAGNNEGETPLMIAALKGYPENVKLLLDAGADLKVKDKRGETPLMHAVERNHTDVIQLLRDAGAKE